MSDSCRDLGDRCDSLGAVSHRLKYNNNNNNNNNNNINSTYQYEELSSFGSG